MGRVIVTGGRDWNEEARLRDTLDALTERDDVIIHGACPTGADAMAELWAKHRGMDIERFHANWRELGKRAGPIRNEKMIRAGADLVIAFEGGRGTEHCKMLAKKYDIPVIEISRRPPAPNDLGRPK